MIDMQKELPVLIEAFVLFYGEQYRGQITTNLNRTKFVFYEKPEALESKLAIQKRALYDELDKKMMSSLGDVTFDTYKTKLLKYGNIDSRYSPLFSMYEFLDGRTDDNSGIIKVLQAYGIDITEENFDSVINTENAIEKIKVISESKDLYNTLVKKVELFYEENKRIIQNIETCQRNKENITKQKNIAFLNSFMDIMDDHDKKIVEAYKTEENAQLYDLHCTIILFNMNFTMNGLIDSFSTANEQLLQTGAKEYVIKDIQNERIKYFKSQGIDLGNDYESYVQDQRCVQIRPSSLLADKVVTLRRQLTKEREEEYIASLPMYAQMKDELDQLSIEGKTNDAMNVIRKGITCVEPSYTLENGIPTLFTTLFYNLDSIPDYEDIFFIHEVNHIVETHLLSVDEVKAVYSSGYDIIETTKNEEQENDNDDRRGYELFSETINQLLTEELVKTLHDHGHYIFANPTSAKNKGAVSYSFGNSIVEPFYQQYRQEIIASRLNGDMNIIFNTVGKENFDRLNQEINNLFLINRYSLLDAKSKHVINDETIKFDKIIENTREIYRNMYSYSNASVDGQHR